MINLPVLAFLEGGGYDPMDAGGAGGVLWTWIIFLLALPVIWIVVMGPVTRGLTARDEEALAAIASAEKASHEAEKARADVEIKLGEAHASAAKLLSEARERAESREHEIIELAKKEAEGLRERASRDIETARDQALSAIRSEVVEISLAAAGQVLGRRVDSEDDRRLVGDLVSATKVQEL
ncbi:MAG TPA: ATP synthase F0 subunit B [Planctomycetes bacterium]|jgi:F-type H+-transporting ATPase subunit b|nr:F0F1 ATP synthase subunit B [Planctomycetota bacterium]HIL53141.1 ATP synthase F0 subunit B [Planctomycetota bacterium]